MLGGDPGSNMLAIYDKCILHHCQRIKDSDVSLCSPKLIDGACSIIFIDLDLHIVLLLL